MVAMRQGRNKQQCSPIWLATVIVVLACPSWICAQGPTAPPKPSEPSGLTLDQLPLPPDAILVITDNVRQALNQMRVGSVVLSAERYQSLMEELARLRREALARQAEFVFATCQVRGQIVPGLKQPRAQLKIELSFRTTVADQRVPLPLSGLQLTAAELDGALPPWQIERDQIVLRLAEPGTHRLLLEGWSLIETSGGEQRLNLERFPSALITTLELTTPATVAQAQLRGGPRLAIDPAGPGSRLRGEGLGPISQLDVSWREVAAAAAVPLTVTGTIRHTLSEKQVDLDARLRLEGGREPVAELRLRLATTPKDLEIELLASEGGSGTALTGVATADAGVWSVRLPQVWRPESGPLQLRLRGSAAWSGPASLGVVEMVQPAAARQTGLVVVRVAAGLPVRLAPGNVLSADARELPERDAAGAVNVFRYSRQPVRLEAFLEPVRLEPAAEVRLSHAVRLTPGRAMLACDLEMLRLTRLAVQEVVLSVPPGWRVDRRALAQPLVAQWDENGGRLRIRLLNRTATPFRLRLEGELPGGDAERINFELPRLLELREEIGVAAAAVRLVLRPERVVVDGDDVAVRLDAGTSGLIDEQNRTPSLEGQLRLPSVFQVAGEAHPRPAEAPPARLALFWHARLPRVTGSAEVFLETNLILLRQTFHWQWTQRLPTQMILEVPAGVTVGPTATLLADAEDLGASSQTVAVNLRSSGEGREAVIELPPRLGRRSTLTLTSTSQADWPLTPTPLPLKWLRPTAVELAWESGWPIAVWSTRKLSLRGGGGDWFGAAAVAPHEVFRLTGWNTPCPVVAARASPQRPAAIVDQTVALVTPQDGNLLRTQWRWHFAQVNEAQLVLACGWPRDQVQLDRLTINEVSLPWERVTVAGGEAATTRLEIHLDLSLLQRGFTLGVEATIKGTAPRWGVQRAPAWQFLDPVVENSTRWLLRLPAEQWVIDGSTPVVALDEAEGLWEMVQWGAPSDLEWRALARTPWRLGCSAVVVCVALAAVTGRRPRTWLVFFACLLLVMGIFHPWLLRQAAVAALPGVLVAAGLLGFQAWRWRVTGPRRLRFGAFRADPRVLSAPLPAASLKVEAGVATETRR